MATTASQTGLDSLTEQAQSAARLGLRALRAARTYSRPSAVTLDIAINAASSQRRRLAIAKLRCHSGGVALTTLAEDIAAELNGVSVNELTSQQRKRVYVSMYQTHIPKLESMGLVHYDEDSGRVHSTPALRDVAVWLDDASLRFGGGDA